MSIIQTDAEMDIVYKALMTRSRELVKDRQHWKLMVLLDELTSELADFKLAIIETEIFTISQLLGRMKP